MFEMKLNKENDKLVVSPTIADFSSAHPDVRLIGGEISSFSSGEKVKFEGYTAVSYTDTKSGKSGEFAALAFSDQRIMSASAYQRQKYDRATMQPIREPNKIGLAELVAGNEYTVNSVTYMDGYGNARTKYYLTR